MTATPTTFRRGVALTTASTYGHGSTSSLGPTDGNGFDVRYAQDLALLAGLGVTDLRLTFDWPRFQPSPGRLDEFWVEHIDDVLAAGDAHGLRVWATLHDGAVPRWFDNEGGTGDADAMIRRWPHWVERVADRFGDRVHGWVPFAGIARDMPLRPWLDTWGILRGAGSHVVASMAAADFDHIAEFLGSTDSVGVVLHAPAEPHDAIGDQPTDGEIDRVAERLAAEVRQCAEASDGVPMLVGQFTAHHRDADVAGAVTHAMVRAIEGALADRIDLDVVFADPALGVATVCDGLLGHDRSVRPAGSAYFEPSPSNDHA